MTDFSDKLKKLRNDRGLTQDQLAEILKTSPSYISNVENGKTNPGTEFLIKLKKELKISIDWLLGDKTRISDPLMEKILIMLDQLPDESRKKIQNDIENEFQVYQEWKSLKNKVDELEKFCKKA